MSDSSEISQRKGSLPDVGIRSITVGRTEENHKSIAIFDIPTDFRLWASSV